MYIDETNDEMTQRIAKFCNIDLTQDYNIVIKLDNEEDLRCFNNVKISKLALTISGDEVDYTFNLWSNDFSDNLHCTKTFFNNVNFSEGMKYIISYDKNIDELKQIFLNDK